VCHCVGHSTSAGMLKTGHSACYVPINIINAYFLLSNISYSCIKRTAGGRSVARRRAGARQPRSDRRFATGGGHRAVTLAAAHQAVGRHSCTGERYAASTVGRRLVGPLGFTTCYHAISLPSSLSLLPSPTIDDRIFTPPPALTRRAFLLRTSRHVRWLFEGGYLLSCLYYRKTVTRATAGCSVWLFPQQTAWYAVFADDATSAASRPFHRAMYLHICGEPGSASHHVVALRHCSRLCHYTCGCFLQRVADIFRHCGNARSPPPHSHRSVCVGCYAACGRTYAWEAVLRENAPT